MVANDFSDIFLIPLSNIISSSVWNVIESGKMYIVPIIIMMIVKAGQCRSAGVDEGSPSIQFYKQVETYIISVILIMFFACKPLNTSTVGYAPSDIQVTNITCVKNGLGVFGGVDKSQILNSPFVRNLPSAPPTLWEGLINQFSIGMTNASIASIPCEANNGGTPTVAIREALSNLDTYEPDDVRIKDLVKQYDLQCYSKALKMAADAQLNSSNSTVPKFNDLSFNGTDTQQFYTTTANGVDLENPLSATIETSLWPEKATPENTTESIILADKMTVDCSDLGDHVSDVLDDDIAYGKGAGWFKSLAGLRKDRSDAENEAFFRNFLYSNIAKEKGSLQNIIYKYGKKAITAINDVGNTNAIKDTSLVDASLNTEALDYVRDTANGTWALVTSAFESGKVHTYQLSAPLVISVLKACLVIALPILLLITGFKPQTLLFCTIAYFSIDFTKFFLEFGAFLDETIMAILDIVSFTGNKTTMATIGAMTYLSEIINYGLVSVWLVFSSWMGVRMGNMLEPAQSTSENTSNGATSVASRSGSQTVKTTKAVFK